MNILMMTNSYLPRIGGVANSVKAFTELYRQKGHRTIVVAPEYGKKQNQEKDIVRIPSIKNMGDIDYSVILPIPGYLDSKLKDFKPDIVHSHHPFLIGSTAQRVSVRYNIPLIFTHHTRYELYTHYTPLEMINMKKFIIALSSGYENLCDRVIAPSQSIKEILINRDVTTPIEVVPTGVDVQKYSNGNGSEIREKFNIPKDAFLVGYVGRVTKEKNLIFLAKSLSKFLQKNKNAYAIVVGSGTLNDHLASIFDKNNISDRTILPGSLTGSDLINAYHSLNAFVFASKTETQGMVIIEAMAAGVPVVAIDATGITDVLDTTKNGYLINSEKRDDFAQALEKLKSLTHEQYEQMCENARKTANNFSMEKTTQKMLNIYQDAIKNFSKKAQKHQNFWDNILHKFKLEFSMLSNAINAVEQGFNGNKK